MKRPEPEPNLIEYVVSFLSVLDYANIDIVHLERLSRWEELFLPEDLHKMETAYEGIKFMDEMPGGFLIYRADDDEEIIYANKALLRIFQCETLTEFRELTGNSFKGIVHPEDLDEIEQSIRKQISESRYDLDYVEYRITRKDGIVRWIEDYGHYIHSETVGGIFYVFLGDATEKKERQILEQEELLSEKEQKIQNLIEEYDKERKLIRQEHLRRLEVIEGLSINYETILYADLEMDKILPYRLSTRTEYQFEKKYQVRGFTWYISDYVKKWVYPEDKEFVLKATSPAYIREKLAETKTYYINFRVVQDDKIQYIQLRFVNVGSKEGVFQIVMGYRKVDEEIRRELEQKQLLEEALNRANLAITAKDTFLSNMSHDIRTPLNAVTGFAALAREHIHDGKTVKGYLHKIEDAGRQLLELLDKVLEMAWEEANDIEVSENECNLRSIVNEAYEFLLPQAEEKGIMVSLDMGGIEHSDVYSDTEKLRQILLQLVGNAVKYTEKGGVINVKLSEEERLSNDYAVYQFVVSDSGIGMGKDFLERIFKPFEREKNTTFSGVHGTGLGLTIVRNAVEKMGGSITVDSVKGKGSTFVVTFRFRIQNNPVSTVVNTTEVLEQLKEQKILIVEDNEINLEIVTEILEGLGFSIDSAENGSIAVEKLKNSEPGNFALVLMDIQMPVMDGRKAAREIRRLGNPILANIPIIALSADAFESDKRLSIESGMDAHLTKPIDVPLLLETMAKTIQAHAAQ